MSQSLKYYLYLDETVQGPHDLEYIKSMHLDGSTKICPEGSTEWASLDSINTASSKNIDILKDFSGYSQDYMPTKIGKYNIVNEIGRGGMGSVYLAVDELLNRKVAVKELKIDEHKRRDADNYNNMIRRFKKEAQILAQLNHKNIVSVYDIIEQNHNQYIIMEFLDGKNLEELLNEQGTFPLEKAVQVISDTCLALDYIHKKGIIHRDVKPSNIVILNDGVTKLTDFGVTRDMNSSTMTMDGSLVGTIAYASPEQDSKELDGRSDIFSLGVVLYELVTGQKPFVGETIASVLLKIATKDPVKPSELNPNVHKMLEAIIMKAMSKSLSQRYATAMDMYNDLQSYKQALQTNNAAALSGMKVNESFFSQNKVDSIPPGKVQAKDILNQSIPPGKYNFKDFNKSNTHHTPPPNTLPPIKPGVNTTSGGTKVNSLLNKPANTNPDNVTVTNENHHFGMQKHTTGSLADKLPENNPLSITGDLSGKLAQAEEHIEASKSKKLNKKSHVAEQIEHERKEAVKRVVIPTTIIFMSLILVITGIINFTDVVLLVGATLTAYRDYNKAQVIKPLSYLMMLLTVCLVFMFFEMVVPSFDNSKISNYIYYLLDFSILLFSFIGGFFINKGMDLLSENKNKNIRPIGGVLKSIVTFLSIIAIISSTNIVNTGFVKNQLVKSKFANTLSAVLPDLKIGKKMNVSFGRYGFKISK